MNSAPDNMYNWKTGVRDMLKRSIVRLPILSDGSSGKEVSIKQ